jgi:predicted PurR-regulated permease PerM
MSGDERPRGWDIDEPPRWARRLVWQTLLVIAAAFALLSLLRTLRGLILWLVYALFLSFALEPAVDWLEKKGWRRGLSSLLLLTLLGLALVGIALMVIPLIINGIQLIIDELPSWLASLNRFTERCCNITVDVESVRGALEKADVSLASLADDVFAILAGTVGSLVSGIFAAFTVGLFTYYLVAQAPNVRRSILSLLPPRRQEEVLYVWETAIDKMGGYLYSRLALAFINGGLFFIVLKIFDVPFALALALFQGFVAAFIPIVGTYIAVIVPALVALVTSSNAAVIAIIVYALVYQQLENYWLSPKISAKTMSLHPAVALGAGIAGGAIGGLLWAFVALPVAATIQAAIGAYVEHHEVIESELTREREAASRERPAWRRKLAGWGRKITGHEEQPEGGNRDEP